MVEVNKTHVQAQHEAGQSAEAFIDPVVIDVARKAVDPMLEVYADPDNVFGKVAMYRLSQMTREQRQGFKALLVDPSNSGVIAPRWRTVDGAMPVDVDDTDPSRLVTLWASNQQELPRLVVPDHLQADVFSTARSIGMMGQAKNMYSDEEVDGIDLDSNTVIHVVGAANLANRIRFATLNKLMDSKIVAEEEIPSDITLIATADSSRVLRDAELNKVRDFAPNAQNEFDLMVASAIAEGFIPDPENLTGPKIAGGSLALKFTQPKTGLSLHIIVPFKHERPDGRPETGIYNAFSALQLNGSELMGREFSLAGKRNIHINSSHYALMGILNIADASTKLGIPLSGVQTIGDVQSGRTANAYAIEFGLAQNRIDHLDDTLRANLLT